MLAGREERRGAGDHDEEADDAGEDGAGDDVDPLVREVAPRELLVGGVGLDEREAPRGERRPDDAGRDDQRIARQRHAGNDETVRRGAPRRMREHPRGDVRDEDRRQQQEDVLDAMETASKHDEADEERRDGNGEQPADSRELEAGRDAGELGAGRADVRDDKRARDDERARAAPYLVRTSATSPRPVARPRRDPSSWNTTSAAIESSSTHRRLYP